MLLGLPSLTPRQKATLGWIEFFMRTHAMAPTIEEVAEGTGVSLSTAHGHMTALERKGYLTRHPYARGLELCPTPRLRLSVLRSAALPVAEALREGKPIDPRIAETFLRAVELSAPARGPEGP